MTLTQRDIDRLQRQAEHRIIDMGPFGGVETFVSHNDIVLSRETVIELCQLAKLGASK